VTRAAVSFAAISAAEADIDRVAAGIRQRLADVDRELAPLLDGLSPEEAARVRAAHGRRDAAVADLYAVLEQLGTALGAARDAGLLTAYVRPVWS
jgi:hypothetical protein